MDSIKEKFKRVVSKYRLVAGQKWHESCNIDFIISLSSIEKKENERFFNWLIDEEILLNNGKDLSLSEKGEEFVYGKNNDPTNKILQRLKDLDMAEGFCWQFASYNSFKSSLNPVEEKNFYPAIERLIKEGLLVKDGFDYMLKLTKLGEKKLKELFY